MLDMVSLRLQKSILSHSSNMQKLYRELLAKSDSPDGVVDRSIVEPRKCSKGRVGLALLGMFGCLYGSRDHALVVRIRRGVL